MHLAPVVLRRGSCSSFGTCTACSWYCWLDVAYVYKVLHFPFRCTSTTMWKFWFLLAFFITLSLVPNAKRSIRCCMSPRDCLHELAWFWRTDCNSVKAYVAGERFCDIQDTGMEISFRSRSLGLLFDFVSFVIEFHVAAVLSLTDLSP